MQLLPNGKHAVVHIHEWNPTITVVTSSLATPSSGDDRPTDQFTAATCRHVTLIRSTPLWTHWSSVVHVMRYGRRNHQLDAVLTSLRMSTRPHKTTTPTTTARRRPLFPLAAPYPDVRPIRGTVSTRSRSPVGVFSIYSTGREIDSAYELARLWWSLACEGLSLSPLYRGADGESATHGDDVTRTGFI